MDVNVFDADLKLIGIVDSFESLIWTDRYYGAGDFEIAAIPTIKFITAISSGVYLTLKNSEHVMIIDTINIKANVETGNRAIVKGDSLETILNRRIVWNPTVLSGSLQDGIHQLLDENAINPTDPDRKINLLEFEESDDPAITSLQVDSQFFGEFLYKAILDLCISKHIGFKITLTEAGNFRFKLYSGTDRTYDQLDEPYVVFSPEYENLINSDYMITTKLLKTVTLVAGERGVGNVRTAVAVAGESGAGSDLARREMFTDAAGVTKNVSGGTLSDEEYLAQITQKGAEDLAKNTVLQNFDGQAETTKVYVYNVDFFLGDLLQIADQYGHETASRVIEMIHSQDLAGTKTYPTFSSSM